MSNLQLHRIEGIYVHICMGGIYYVYVVHARIPRTCWLHCIHACHFKFVHLHSHAHRGVHDVCVAYDAWWSMGESSDLVRSGGDLVIVKS